VRTALIGWSGFVGGNLASAHPFDAQFRRSDVAAIVDEPWDLVVCAGLPAEKWRINRDPAPDLANLEALQAALARARIAELVVISSIDVYPSPDGVDEATQIELTRCHPYGRHRLLFERWAARQFPATILRLPGLFGPGLKKNVVYDILHNNRLDVIHADARFQFYPLTRLWGDICVALDSDLSLVNLATEPVTVAEIAEALTGRVFEGRPAEVVPANYDMRTLHASAFGRTGAYLLDRATVLAELARFAAVESESSER
jgi:nucleoside-diphosphate-sugar epimerase